MPTVESKGVPGIVTSTTSCRSSQCTVHADDIVITYGCSDGVRSKEGDSFLRRETSVSETGKDAGHAVGGLGDGLVGSGCLGCWAAELELETGSTRAVGGADGGSQMDALKIMVKKTFEDKVNSLTSHRLSDQSPRRQGIDEQ